MITIAKFLPLSSISILSRLNTKCYYICNCNEYCFWQKLVALHYPSCEKLIENQQLTAVEAKRFYMSCINNYLKNFGGCFSGSWGPMCGTLLQYFFFCLKSTTIFFFVYTGGYWAFSKKPSKQTCDNNAGNNNNNNAIIMDSIYELHRDLCWFSVCTTIENVPSGNYFVVWSLFLFDYPFTFSAAVVSNNGGTVKETLKSNICENEEVLIALKNPINVATTQSKVTCKIEDTVRWKSRGCYIRFCQLVPVQCINSWKLVNNITQEKNVNNGFIVYK